MLFFFPFLFVSYNEHYFHSYSIWYDVLAEFSCILVSSSLTFENLDATVDVSNNQIVGDIIYTIRISNDLQASVTMTTTSTFFDLDPSNNSAYIIRIVCSFFFHSK